MRTETTSAECPIRVDFVPAEAGCGAIMRAAPFGLAAGSRDEAFEWARTTGVLTHGHPSGYLSAAYFASLVFDLAHGRIAEVGPLDDRHECVKPIVVVHRGAFGRRSP